MELRSLQVVGQALSSSLEIEDILEFAIICFCPKMALGACIDKLRRNSNHAAGLADTALKDVVNVEFCRHCRDVNVLALEAEYRGPGCDLQLRDLGQQVDPDRRPEPGGRHVHKRGGLHGDDVSRIADGIADYDGRATS